MKHLRNTFLLLFLTTFFVVSYSQEQSDHLEPLDYYYPIVSTVMSKANLIIQEELLLDPYFPEIRFIKWPSFEHDEVLDLYLDKEKGKYYLLFNRIRKEEDDQQKFPMHVCEIDSASALLLNALFKRAVYETRYHEKKSDITLVGIDGTTYFYIINDYPDKGGKIWSPLKNSVMWNLTELTSEIIELVMKGKPIFFDESLVARIEKLKEDLVQKP